MEQKHSPRKYYEFPVKGIRKPVRSPKAIKNIDFHQRLFFSVGEFESSKVGDYHFNSL